MRQWVSISEMCVCTYRQYGKRNERVMMVGSFMPQKISYAPFLHSLALYIGYPGIRGGQRKKRVFSVVPVGNNFRFLKPCPLVGILIYFKCVILFFIYFIYLFFIYSFLCFCYVLRFQFLAFTIKLGFCIHFCGIDLYVA